MQIGEGFYCDTCSVEIKSGSRCVNCNPDNGSEEIIYTFIIYPPAAEDVVQPTEGERPWWKLW